MQLIARVKETGAEILMCYQCCICSQNIINHLELEDYTGIPMKQSNFSSIITVLHGHLEESKGSRMDNIFETLKIIFDSE
ncbi:UDP-galactose transporter [Dirofilaria immitis]